MTFNNIMINDEVIFNINTGELVSANNTGETVMLNSPTARCLQLLLEHNPQVISRDDFMERVWGAKGIVVSQNTFYQNISLLRKSLKSAGLNDDIIVTVRGKGFKLSSEAVVVPVEMVEESAGSFSGVPGKTSPASVIEDVEITDERRNPVILKDNMSLMLKIPLWVKALLAVFVVLELVSLYHRYFS